MKVIVVSPGGEELGGGMGTVSKNIKSFIQNETKHSCRVIDSRGEINYIVSFLFLFKALVQVTLELLLNKQKTILHINVSERSSFYRKACFIFLARCFNTQSILHHHGAELIPFYNNCGKFSKRVTQYCIRNTTKNIVLGQKWASFIQKNIPDAAPTYILFNAVPFQQYIKSATPRLTISLIANLTERKGVKIALEAIARLQDQLDICIHLVGGGEIEKYQGLSKELGIEHRCTFHGWSTREKTFKVMVSSDMLILPSYEEGLPMVILEAMAHEIPVICTAVGAIGEVFTHRKECLFAEVGSTESLADAISEMHIDKELRSRLMRNAKDLYLREFSIEKYMKRLIDIYL